MIFLWISSYLSLALLLFYGTCRQWVFQAAEISRCCEALHRILEKEPQWSKGKNPLTLLHLCCQIIFQVFSLKCECSGSPIDTLAVLQAYSNRAACYTKLGALPEGLKDAEKCIELDPTFSKGYNRKGAVQFFMKEYDKAMETYQEGLKHDPHNQELLDGIKR